MDETAAVRAFVSHNLTNDASLLSHLFVTRTQCGHLVLAFRQYNRWAYISGSSIGNGTFPTPLLASAVPFLAAF